jgi:hypothetical protein
MQSPSGKTEDLRRTDHLWRTARLAVAKAECGEERKEDKNPSWPAPDHRVHRIRTQNRNLGILPRLDMILEGWQDRVQLPWESSWTQCHSMPVVSLLDAAPFEDY